MKHLFPAELLLAAILTLSGCGKSAATVDDAPFREAVARYVQANNMAMKLKEIKEPPKIDGDKADLTASMTHEQLGGPSVTWKFEFVKQSDGTWQAIRHSDNAQ